jgi:hypothetical protein
MVAACFGLETAAAGWSGRTVRRHPIAKTGHLPDEAAFRVGCLDGLPVNGPFAIHQHVVFL